MADGMVIPAIVGHLLGEGFSTSETGFDATGRNRWWLLSLDERAWIGVVAGADGEPIGRVWIAAEDELVWGEATPAAVMVGEFLAHSSPYWRYIDGIEFDESETARTWQDWLTGTSVTPGPALLAAMERFSAARAGRVSTERAGAKGAGVESGGRG